MAKSINETTGEIALDSFISGLTPAQKLTCGYVLGKANAYAKALGADGDFAFLLRLDALYCYVRSRCGEEHARRLNEYIAALRKSETFRKWSRDVDAKTVAECERKTIRAVRKLVDDCQNELDGFASLMRVNLEEWQ